ncbi:MAG: hypothetical protein U1E71_00570 [Ramlibacter sp.]
MPLVAFLLFAGSSTSALSEPGRVERWLMGEPMSLFDWGIYKIDKKISELKSLKTNQAGKFFFGSANYDWNANRLRLKVNFVGKGTDAECVDSIKWAKGALLNYTWSEKEQVGVAKDVLAGYFAHEGGYQATNQPADVGEQLVRITVLEATVFVPAESGSYAPRARCAMDFQTSDVNVVKR